MTELLLKDQLELQKRSAERAEWEKIATLQEAISVLKTRFDGAIDSIRDKLSAAVSDEDLKELRREMEAALRDAINSIREQIIAANDQQSTNLLGQVQLMLSQGRQATAATAEANRLAAAEDQRNLRRQIFFALFTWGLGIIGALFVFWLTTRPT